MAFQTLQNLSIHQSKKELTLVIEKLNYLQSMENELTQSLQSKNENEWKSAFVEIEKHKTDIEKLLEKYSNKQNLNELKLKLTKRKRKRAQLKRRNKKLKIEHEKTLKNRQKLHEIIDNWIQNEKEKDMKLLKEKNEMNCIEILLSEVMKRINGAKEHINKFTALKELRRLRKVALAQEKPDLCEKSFEIRINQMINVWKDALNEYETEEKKLQLLLNNKTKTTEDQWKECLFGEYSENETIELNAEKNLHDFLEIRRTWDTYIVPEDSTYGSSIPIGWVMPNENPTDKWKPYQNSDS